MTKIWWVFLCLVVISACSQQDDPIASGPGGSSETTAQGDSVELTLQLKGQGPWEVSLLKKRKQGQLSLVSNDTIEVDSVSFQLDTNKEYEISILGEDQMTQLEIIDSLIILELDKKNEDLFLQWKVIDTLAVRTDFGCGAPIIEDEHVRWEWDDTQQTLYFIGYEDGIYPFEFNSSCVPYNLKISGDEFEWIKSEFFVSSGFEYDAWFFSPPSNWTVSSSVNDSIGFFGDFEQLDSGMALGADAYFTIDQDLFEANEIVNEYTIMIFGKFQQGLTPIINYGNSDSLFGLWINDSGYVEPFNTNTPVNQFNQSTISSSKKVTDGWGYLTVNANLSEDTFKIYWGNEMILDMTASSIGAATLEGGPWAINPSSNPDYRSLTFFKDVFENRPEIEVHSITVFDKAISENDIIAIVGYGILL